MDQLTVAAAAMITQFYVLLVTFVAAILVRRDNWGNDESLAWVILALALVSIGVMLCSEQLTRIWAPMFGGSGSIGLSLGHTILVVVVLDVLTLALITLSTGGAQTSPFAPVLLLLPALAVFLGEPAGRITFYLILVIGALTVTSRPWPSSDQRRELVYPGPPMAHWLVTVATLSFATFIGVVTRR